jgi:hypothetical protein
MCIATGKYNVKDLLLKKLLFGCFLLRELLVLLTIMILLVLFHIVHDFRRLISQWVRELCVIPQAAP